MPPMIDPEICQHCGTCYDICPQDVFRFQEEAAPDVDYPDECWHCGACVMDCPVEAIHLRLPLPMHIVPAPANYGPPAEYDNQALANAAAFSRSVVVKK